MSSASGGFVPRPPPGLFPWTSLGDFCHQFPGFVPLRNKFLAAPLATTSEKADKRDLLRCEIFTHTEKVVRLAIFA